MASICLNEDNSNFAMSFPWSEMTVEGLKRQARAYATGQVSRIIYCVNAQRSSFPSTTMEPIWKGVECHDDGSITFEGKPLNSKSMEKTILRLKTMFDQGIDPYAIWVEETRRLGREAWLSIRMNDMHDALVEDSVMHDKFWREHKEFRISTYDENSWTGKGYDYAHEEVRKYQLNFLREVLERYDTDGIELDWSRFPQQLRAGFEMMDAHFLTDFHRQAKALIHEFAQKRGHELKIGVRLPSRPELAMRHGFEINALRDERLVDAVVVTNFFPTTDSDMPIELWRDILGKEIELDAGLEFGVQSDPYSPFMLATVETALGYACEYLYRGADRIYLFNYMRGLTGMHDVAALQKLLANGGAPETAYPMKRRHVVSFCQTNYVSLDIRPILPLDVDNRNFQQLRINVGGGTDGHDAKLLLAFREEDGRPPLELRINGTPCHETKLPKIIVRGGVGTVLEGTLISCDPTAAMTTDELAMPGHVKNLRYFQIPAGALHDGENCIQIRISNETKAQIVWTEVDLR